MPKQTKAFTMTKATLLPNRAWRITDLHNDGLDGIFGDAGATKIIHLLEDIELKAAA